MKDIFTKIAERDAVTATKAPKMVKRHRIMYSGKGSRKLYTYTEARKLVSRAKRMGLDCYTSPVMIKV